MKRPLLVTLLLVLPLAAQEQKKPDDSKPKVQKIFILKYADPAKVANLLAVLASGPVQPSPDLHALAVTTSPEIMPAIEDAIQKLDVPAAAPQNIELNVYYLIGGDADGIPGETVPKDLESVVVQLKNSFAFKNYRLLDALSIRTRAGFRGADTSGSPGPIAPGAPAISTQFKIQSVDLSSDAKTVRINRMQAGVRMPVIARGSEYTFLDLGLNADVDVKEGQKVVVGRLSVNKDQALFLVLTARLAN